MIFIVGCNLSVKQKHYPFPDIFSCFEVEKSPLKFVRIL